MTGRDQMLKDIGMVDFAAVELSLYLDTHPQDMNALEYYNYYNRLRTKMKGEFSKRYYPLTAELADCNQEWRWGEAPLPWEGECG